jgi:hypothetical protein
LYRWGVLAVRRRWVLATSIGAAVAWSIGMLRIVLGDPNWAVGTVILTSIVL